MLQPVLKMKVDELFLFWLSEPSTQAMLKDYLNKIKNGEEIDLSHGDFKSSSTLLTENNNNNIASKTNVTDRMTAALGAPYSPPSATLPSASGSNNRAGVNARALRRSVSTKKVKHLCILITPDLSPCRLLYPGPISLKKFVFYQFSYVGQSQIHQSLITQIQTQFILFFK